MEQFDRATRGGVGAVIPALALAIVALAAGWLAGAIYDRAAPQCVGSCASVSAAEDDTVAVIASPTAQPTPTSAPEPAGFPFVSARSLSVIEGGCGAELFGRDEHRSLPPASLTKLMTAAVAVEHAGPDTMITSNVDGAQLYDETGSTIMGLKPGMELSLRDLLYGLLLPSGNDAAIAIAEGVGGSEQQFVAMMNEKAASLGLDDTHFTNPHGLDDDGLRSSAHDMAMLARYVMQNALLREIVAAPTWQPRWDGPPLWNGNRFISEYPGADGVKIGYTEESQQTIVASATRDSRRLIVALMRSNDRYTDAERVLDWAFDQPSACP